jgi:hypothetical protein
MQFSACSPHLWPQGSRTRRIFRRFTNAEKLLVCSKTTKKRLALLTIYTLAALAGLAPDRVFAASTQVFPTVTLTWDPGPDSNIAGYRLRYGSEPGNYTQAINAGNSSTAILSNLTAGSTYFAVVTAYSVAGTESAPSNEIGFAVSNFPAITANSFATAAPLSFSGAAKSLGKGSPYPSTINASSMAGLITNVTAHLNGLTHPNVAQLDFLLVGPGGQNVMLMSDAGGARSVSNINLIFDRSATASLTTARINSGTYLPTNLHPKGDKDAFPAPAPVKPYGNALSIFNGTTPNGGWNLFILDEATSGSGSITNWSLDITTQLAAPIVTTMVATGVTSSSATLNGTINPLGLPSIWSFNFGISSTYSNSQPAQTGGSDTTAALVAFTLTGLKPATTYHYQLTGQNGIGTSKGADLIFTTASLIDSDGDGIPNDYEVANGLNPKKASDAALDPDGDGLTNLQEYLAGTDPRSAASAFRITNVQPSGDDFLVTFSTVLGKRYQVQQTDDLLNVPWSVLQDNIRGSGRPVTIIDFAAGEAVSKRFYRAVLLP